MLRLLTDENFNQRILRGLRRRINKLDCILAQDALIAGISDEVLLDLCAIDGRVIVTHDAKTMIGHAVSRIDKGLPILILVPARLDIGRAIEDLEVLLKCATESDLRHRIVYLPL